MAFDVKKFGAAIRTLRENSGLSQAALAEQAGAERDSDVVLYCGGGVSASLAFEALQAAGYRRVSIYDGSWSDWASDDSLPREHHER